jgi:hypothetical protein
MTAPKFADFQPLNIDSGEWAQPKIKVTLDPHKVGQLVRTVNGLHATLELLARADQCGQDDEEAGAEVALNDWMRGGLLNASLMLAESLSDHLSDAVDLSVSEAAAKQQGVNHG